jgi:hypothetical protein
MCPILFEHIFKDPDTLVLICGSNHVPTSFGGSQGSDGGSIKTTGHSI